MGNISITVSEEALRAGCNESVYREMVLSFLDDRNMLHSNIDIIFPKWSDLNNQKVLCRNFFPDIGYLLCADTFLVYPYAIQNWVLLTNATSPDTSKLYNTYKEAHNNLLEFTYRTHSDATKPDYLTQIVVGGKQVAKFNFESFCSDESLLVSIKGDSSLHMMGFSKITNIGIITMPIERTESYIKHEDRQRKLPTPLTAIEAIFEEMDRSYRLSKASTEKRASSPKATIKDSRLSPEEVCIDNDLFSQLKAIGAGDIERGIKSVLDSHLSLSETLTPNTPAQ
jgi:hypothetical protein